MQDGPFKDQSQEGISSTVSSGERRRSRSDSLREEAKRAFQAEDILPLNLKKIFHFHEGGGLPSPDSPTIADYKEAKNAILTQFANDQDKQKRALLELKAEHLGKPLPAGWEKHSTIEEMKQKLRVITPRNIKVSDVVQSQDPAIEEAGEKTRGCKPQ